MSVENVYLGMLRNVLNTGVKKEDRTGTGTYSTFGPQIAYSAMPQQFPLLTTKKVHWKSIVVELLWFLRGDTNVKYLHDHGVTIWDSWIDKNGDLGPIYGSRWRNWDGTDQIAEAIYALRHHPDSRRIIINSWDVPRLPEMALPPCHMMFQFYSEPVGDKRTLHLKLYQRSADIFLGVPFNIASYALLLNIIAHLTEHYVGFVIHTFGDLHLYTNHVEQAEEQLSREPRELPQLRMKHFDTLNELTPDHFVIEEYNPHPAIKAPVAV